jgi:hypothetical protein
MSKEKRKKIAGGTWGGARERAGHPKTGVKKTKICVSLNKKIWHATRRSWRGKASHLVEKLVSAYVNQGESGQNVEATT